MPVCADTFESGFLLLFPGKLGILNDQQISFDSLYTDPLINWLVM